MEKKEDKIGTLSTVVSLGKSIQVGDIEIIIKELRTDRATIIIKAPKSVIIRK